MVAANQGMIYFVGAGPGDPGLITVKGLALVREADAIVGDILAHAPLLSEARPEAERHDFGSLRRGNKKPQAEINQLLLTMARQGKTIVRLFEGDPFVFGRAAEEMVAARQAGIWVAVVPGVTSAIAAPAYAGVPVTHWDYGASFAVVSGFTPDEARVQPNWTALAGVETLIILMPLENLPEIVARLMAAGRPADTPVLVVQQGTLPAQKQTHATLLTLIEVVEAQGIASQTIVVIGEVTRLATELAWFEAGDAYPLLGQRVLVTRPAHQSVNFTIALRALGAEPISFPTIEIVPVKDTRPLDEAIQRINASSPPRLLASSRPYYDWLGLTSANGVAAFWERLASAGLDSRCLAAVRIAAIGPAAAAALRQRSIIPDLVPEVYTAEGVLAAFDQLGSVASQHFLLARADIARRALAEGLVERGAQVDEIASYHTVPVSGGSPPPAADIVTFTSSSTVQGYVNCLTGRPPAEALQNSRVVCIGPITAATARELGVPVSAMAEEYTIEGLLAALKAEVIKG
jgi:uroporphyrinogen III methyltransferase/synthase